MKFYDKDMDMDKSKTLEAMQNAKKSHEAQMAKIEDALLGVKVDNPTAVSKTKCAFGLWLYKEENHVKEILGSQFFNTIDLYHTKWHSEYLKLFNILFKNEKKSFFSKIMGSSKLEGMELDKAKLYYIELQVTTNELLKILGVSQRRLEAMNESKFY